MYVGYDEIGDSDIKSLEAIAKAIKNGGSNNDGQSGTKVVITEEGMTAGDEAAEAARSSSTSGENNKRGKKRKVKDPEKERRK